MDRFGRNAANVRRLRVEPLESRALLAGHSLDASLGMVAAALDHHVPDTVAAHVLTSIATARASVQSSVLMAHLSDSSGASGLAFYHTVTVHGTTHTDLEVVVFGGAKNASLPVTLNGDTTSVGTVNTNAHGFGILHLSDPSLSISAGDTLTVGTLSGSFSQIGKH